MYKKVLKNLSKEDLEERLEYIKKSLTNNHNIMQKYISDVANGNITPYDYEIKVDYLEYVIQEAETEKKYIEKRLKKLQAKERVGKHKFRKFIAEKEQEETNEQEKQ